MPIFRKSNMQWYRSIFRWALTSTLLAISFVAINLAQSEGPLPAFSELLVILLRNIVIFSILIALSAPVAYQAVRFTRNGPFWHTWMLTLLIVFFTASAGLVVIYVLASFLQFFFSLPDPGSFPHFFREMAPSIYLVSFLIGTIASRIDHLKEKAKVDTERSTHIRPGLSDIQSVDEREDVTKEQSPRAPVLVIREEEDHHIIPYSEIRYLSSHGKKCIVHTVFREYLTNRILKKLESQLPTDTFCRVHKSYIVNVLYISRLQYNMGGSYIAFLKDEEEANIPVGRSYVEKLKTRMGMING